MAWVEVRRLDEDGAAVMRRLGYLFVFLLLILPVRSAYAHVGSKDVYEEVSAGPYKLYVTIRPPNVIPGVASVDVRAARSDAVTAIHITPIPLTGEASKHPPSSDAMVPTPQDPAFFTGGVWMMATGSWQVRFQVEGAAGMQTVSVPVPAVAISTLKMNPQLGWVLAVLGLFLMLSFAGAVGAAVRDAQLEPGAAPTPAQRRRGWVATGLALVFMGLAVYLGGKWWDVEAADYAQGIYKPMQFNAVLNGDTLDLKIQPLVPNANTRVRRSNNDFLPDHGHLMHLYAIREPGMDAVFHLHPVLAGPGDFRMNLPAMPAGSYTLYGDVVHRNGFPETLVTKLDVPAGMPAGPLGPDDAEALPSPLSSLVLGPSYKLPDGYRMIWDKPETLVANTAYTFHFRLVGPDGQPATDMQPYLGMAGHAAFVKTDGTVFAHTHPEGSAAMAALDLANGPGTMQTMDMPKTVAPEVSFPYGFPSAGKYRIFIQMKHGGTVETGVFDAAVQ